MIYWFVLGLVLLVIVLVIIFVLKKIIEWRKLNDLKIEDRVRLKIEVIKTGASILGGAFFLFTLFFTWQNLQLTEKKNRADLEMAQERHRTDLFTNAIGQLGSKQLEVKLGGTYALKRIAGESEKDHWPIMEVLTAYVRENAPWPPQDRSEDRKKLPWVKVKDQETLFQDKGKEGAEKIKIKSGVQWEEDKEKRIKPDTDIQAILTVIGRRQHTFRKGEKQRLDLRETDLRGADLSYAHLEGAILKKARLERVNLRHTHLEGVFLYRAHLEGTNLEGAHLEGTDLRWAHLRGAKLIDAKGLTEDQIHKAIIDEKTRLPDYLKHLEKTAGSKVKKE